MRPELVDKGMTAYLWMLVPTGKQDYCTVNRVHLCRSWHMQTSFSEPLHRAVVRCVQRIKVSHTDGALIVQKHSSLSTSLTNSVL